MHEQYSRNMHLNLNIVNKLAKLDNYKIRHVTNMHYETKPKL